MDDLDTALKAFAAQLDGAALQQCTQAAASVILQAAQSSVPVKSGAMRSHLEVVSHHGEHSATSSVQVAESKKGGIEHAAVFVEYGTQSMPAQPFMRPAFLSKKSEAANTFAQLLQNKLKDFQ